MTHTSPLFKALALCVQAHNGQMDRDEKPHALHCIRVAEKQTTEERMVVALLHDVLEDTNVSYGFIANEFGKQIALAVNALTRGEKETWSGYITRVCQVEDAMYVKLADISDNTRVERMDVKAAKRMPMYKEAYEQIVTRLRELR